MTAFIKHLVGVLFLPGTLAMVLLVSAGVARLLGRRRLAIGQFAAGVAIAYLGSLSLVGNALLGPLERRYPPLDASQPPPAVRYIVVLGSGYVPHDGVPVTAALDDEGLARVVEGVRLARQLPGVHLVLSGGAPEGEPRPAEGYRILARALGLEDASLEVLDSALDTSEEARSVAKLVGAERFILVTSAWHMPRAVRYMEREGGHPIAAPTAQRVIRRGQPFGLRSFAPSWSAGRKTEYAVHEYLGLTALALGFT